MLNISAVGRCALWLACCLTSTFFLLARLPSGALVQRGILCCVFREGVVNSFASRRKNLISVPLRMLANSGVIQVIAANREAGCTWFVPACATDASFFFLLRLSLMRPLQNNEKDIGFEFKFVMSMLSFIHADCVSFRWRGFSRGWLWVSLSFCHGDCANTGCTADIGCLFILFGSMSVVQRRHWCWCETELVCKEPCEVQTCDHSGQAVLRTLLLVFVSWFGFASCERILFAFRCEPVCRTRPRACLVLLAAHLHSQGADILDVFGLVSSFLRLCCTSRDFSFTQRLGAHLLRVGVLHLCPTATSLFACMSRTTEGAL